MANEQENLRLAGGSVLHSGVLSPLCGWTLGQDLYFFMVGSVKGGKPCFLITDKAHQHLVI